ncbi:hypothetical protein [Paraburkholderia sp. RL17-337-BIB-A]|uniref:hypothetical protein n=1 Tax=Paraburkholderia sp. RL17-337-BIB-A TaxID=3031636 RepID=UPI0038B995E2
MPRQTTQAALVQLFGNGLRETAPAGILALDSSQLDRPHPVCKWPVCRPWAALQAFADPVVIYRCAPWIQQRNYFRSERRAAQLVDSGEHSQRRAWIPRPNCVVSVFQYVRDLPGAGGLLITPPNKVSVDTDSRERRTERIKTPQYDRCRPEQSFSRVAGSQQALVIRIQRRVGHVTLRWSHDFCPLTARQREVAGVIVENKMCGRISIFTTETDDLHCLRVSDLHACMQEILWKH